MTYPFVGVYVYTEFKHDTTNTVLNAVTEKYVTTFVGGVYVYRIKFNHEARNAVVNAVEYFSR